MIISNTWCSYMCTQSKNSITFNTIFFYPILKKVLSRDDMFDKMNCLICTQNMCVSFIHVVSSDDDEIRMPLPTRIFARLAITINRIRTRTTIEYKTKRDTVPIALMHRSSTIRETHLFSIFGLSPPIITKYIVGVAVFFCKNDVQWRSVKSRWRIRESCDSFLQQ